MSRTSARLATVSAVLALLIAAPAFADDPGPAVAPQAPASAETRAAYDRMDPLTRSLFWGNEQQLAPSDPVAGVRHAQALRELGRFDQAVEAAQATLVIQPENYDALLELGRAHIARGQPFYGVAALEKARALRPDDWKPLSLLGVAYEGVRRHDDARAAWNEGLRLSPDNPEILNNVATNFMAKGDAASAETLLQRAVRQPGATLKVRLNLAMALGLQGKIVEAEAILRRDLPPDQADRNLQWLRDRTADQASAPDGRTWNTLQQ